MKTTERRTERLRPQQLRELREQTPLAYLPLGILEWHGTHNPVGLDGVKAHALCMRAAEKTGGLVYPTLYYGTPPATNFMDVDGFDPYYCEVYGLPPENFTTDKFGFGTRLEQWHLFDKVLDQALRQIARHGFEAIYVMSGHYPLRNQQSVSVGFQRDMGIPVYLGHEGETADPPDGDHAAQWETSITLALEPDTVDMTEIPAKGQPNPPGVAGKPIADVTPELAQQNLDRALAGVVAKANQLLAARD